MNLKLTPEAGGAPVEVKLQRNGNTTLPDGTKIEYIAFFPDFVLNGGKPDTKSPDYNNPAVQLKITSPSGEAKNGFAFGADLPSGIPIGAPIFGYKFKLDSYEKSPLAHILSIKYDPFYGATIAWYLGGGLLMLSLCLVFFFAHQRIWAIVENGEIMLGGNVNRNEISFKDKFEKIVRELR
jgi:cytochrome c biogenesis protein